MAVSLMFFTACTLLVSDLSLSEKVGQLLMTSVYPDQADEEPDPYIKEYTPGHLLFVGNEWDPERERALIARYQKVSKHPLTIAQDLEWGLSQRLKHVPVFPKNQFLTDTPPQLVEAMGYEIARECRILGVNLNLAPVVDVVPTSHSSFLKPRSFGSNPKLVGQLGVRMMKGLQSGGIKTSAKHFPGHGNTETDSHYDLPYLNRTLSQLNEVDLIPFKALIDEGVDSIMIAHLYLPLIDPLSKASSLSPFVIQDLLRKQLNFKGIILTDDLLMGAIIHNLSYADAALQAYKAGNDILLFTKFSEGGIKQVRDALKEAHKALLKAFKSDELSIDDLDKRVERILNFKKDFIQTQEEGMISTPYAQKLVELMTI